MAPPSPADKPSAATVVSDEPIRWRFTWEAQSHTSILRLLLFHPNTNPSSQCKDLKLSFLPQKSVLTVSFSENESLIETLIQVPVPRVLVDPDSPIHFKALDDHIEVKLVLLLPIDHPLVSDFDSILTLDGSGDELRSLSVDSDLKKLSCMKEEVHFYCRNCSIKLTKGLRCFKEMPSVNWRDVADNWFGNCCCSFGGVSENLVAEYAKSYACTPGLCLLNTTSLLLSRHDLLGYEFPDVKPRQNSINSPNSNCLSRLLVDKLQVEAGGLVNDNLSCTFTELRIGEKTALTNEKSQNRDTGICCPGQMNEVKNDELLENQKVFLDGYLGNGFMVTSSGLSKDIRWVEFLCPQCSCLVGSYPCFDSSVPLDGGVRLFKCYVSTCLPVNGSGDAFRNYTLERMFASQLLESAEDELSFRTIVRDMQTKSPVLQIVLLNPNTWGCAGSLNPEERGAVKLVMRPIMKVLFSASGHDVEFDSVTLDDWVRKNQADEIYMFPCQIFELIRVLEVAKSLSPPSCTLLQGLFLSSMRR